MDSEVCWEVYEVEVETFLNAHPIMLCDSVQPVEAKVKEEEDGTRKSVKEELDIDTVGSLCSAGEVNSGTDRRGGRSEVGEMSKSDVNKTVPVERKMD